MRICLASSPDDFPNGCTIGEVHKVVSKNCTIVLSNIPKGKYAISLFHDKNDDGHLNTGWFGIPKEKYGFSNNPPSRFGVPDFEKCLLMIDSDVTTIIEI